MYVLIDIFELKCQVSQFELQDQGLEQRYHFYLEILNRESNLYLVILQDQLYPTM